MKLDPEAQIRYELKRAKYNANKKEYEEMSKKFSTKNGSFSWAMLIHFLCSTYGWELDYVLKLTLRRIRLVLKGNEQYNQVMMEKNREEKDINNDSKPNAALEKMTGKRTVNSPIMSAKDFIKSGLFKNIKGKKSNG